MAIQSKAKRVKGYIQIYDCNNSIRLQYNEGVYRDLSPGYERNNNIDQKYYENNIFMRRWRKMLEFFKILRGEGLTRQSMLSIEENKNIFLSVNY